MVVVGAGPSGLMAAVQLRRRGIPFRIFEKQPVVGGKFCYSAMGAAAVSNTGLDFQRFHGRHARFVSDALSAFGPDELRQWCEQAGVELVDAEYYGLVKPAGGGYEVVVALLAEVSDAFENRAVASVRKDDTGFVVELADGESLPAKAVVLAAGGANLPQLGGGDDGYRIAQSLGHTLAPVYPALVGVTVAEAWPLELSGLWMDVRLRLLEGRRELAEATGSMLFTRSGLTGEAAFNLSHAIEPALARGADLELAVNFFPGMRDEEVDRWLFRVFGERTREAVHEAIDHILPRRLGAALLAHQKVKRGSRVMQLDERQRANLLQEMLDTRLRVRGTLGMRAAEGVTGGVNLREIDPRTFQSRLSPGLYVVGQLLDISADWGGFEQHFALASGFVAGAAISLDREARPR